MSPVFIEVLLRFWYDPNASRYAWNPAQREYIRHCIQRGILTDSAVAVTANHEALQPYIDAICAVPEPTQKTIWIVEIKQ